MCGVFGCIGLALEHDAASRCVAALRHRGPDGAGIERFTVGNRQVVLGHTRLAILDLSSAGNQPMTSRDGRWWVSYNGEIYNHLDLRCEVPATFRGHSDTETLVESLAASGFDATIGRLNGMFAFAAFDRQAEKLFLVRDPFGIKPLYYALADDGGIAFASEIRALREMVPTGRAVDAGSLQCFLTLRFVPSPRTLWKDVFRLPAGHALIYDIATGRAELRRYIAAGTDHFAGSAEDAVATYHELLARAVERQLLSDVPVGILLSGGVDSALVAALSRRLGPRLPCFTVGFGDTDAESEIAAAAETARLLDLSFVPVRLAPEEVLAGLDTVMGVLEEPIASTSTLAMWPLIKRARRDVTVALTGQGSDEPWGGYRRYQNEIIRRQLRLPGLLAAMRHLPLTGRPIPEAINRAVRSLPISDPALRFEAAYALFTSEERAELTGRADDGNALSDIRYWRDWAGDAREPVEQMMAIDSRTCLPDDWLLYADKISMAFSLETRVPILDLEVVRFVESLPRPYKLRLGRGKIVHKLAAKRHLPATIVHRRKMGFPVPFAAWSRGPLRKRVGERLLEGLPGTGLFRRAAVERLWTSHLDRRRDVGRQIFALFSLAEVIAPR